MEKKGGKVFRKLQTSMPLATKQFKPARLRTFAKKFTKKEEAVQRVKDLAVPTKAGLMRSILSEQKKKQEKKAGDNWSRLRREQPSTGKGVGY